MRTRLLALVLLVAAVATLVIAAPRSTKSSYIYKRGDSTYMSGSLDDLKALQGRYGTEFVWTRQGGREYVITDRAVLDSVRAAFAELDAKERPLKEIERHLEPHERELDRIERRVDDLDDELEDEDLPESTRATLERQLQVAEDEMRKVEDRMRGLEQELERVEREMERFEEAAEAKFERIVERAIDDGKATRVD
jgi:DNA repair exonuclease SbcCD ATPase subunit